MQTIDKMSRKKRNSLGINKNKELIFLSVPSIVYIFIFSYLPLFGLILAFKDYRYDLGFWGSEWIGFKNFEFFFQSNNFMRVTRNTILYNLGFIVLSTLGGLILAVMLNEVGKRWVKLHQTVLFLPYFASAVVAGIITQNFLDHKQGMLNNWLEAFGLPGVQWYYELSYWPVIITAVYLWKVLGFTALIYYAGIHAIDSGQYEAARIDGASRFKLITHITIPNLIPLITILLIMNVGQIFNADFGLFYFTTNDSALLYPATDVIDTHIYRALRELGDIGMPTAIGFYQSLVGFILVVSTNAIVKKINSDNALW